VSSRLSAVEADGCQDSRLHSDCLRMQHDDVGGTWHVNLDVGGEIAATDRVARIWVEDDSVLSMNSTPGRLTPSSSTAAKVNGGLTTGAC
jgi:hypothetical protein